jgi:hypothetical protein
MGKCGTENNFNEAEWERVEWIHVPQESGFLAVQFLFV